MALNIPSLLNQNAARLHPVEVRFAPLFCFGLLTLSCALASFAFACATPFAAFGVIAAAPSGVPCRCARVAGQPSDRLLCAWLSARS